MVVFIPDYLGFTPQALFCRLLPQAEIKQGGDKLKIKADDLRADDMTKLFQTIKKAVEEMND